MTKFWHKIFNQLKPHWPILVVVLVALVIAFQNIDPHKYYTGWDNIHAEFNLPRYARQVFFGAWNEHQGLGAPAAQGQLAEIPRLPMLWLINALFPQNLVRYIFIFTMYLIGGVGMYFYLSQVWLSQKKETIKNWLASLGGIFYLLHILTLQQFYIVFEMFTVQFAFLPFLLLVIHQFAKKITSKTILLFIGIQLLIAPSGHTPTVFYLAALFSVGYGFFLVLKNGWLRAFKIAFLIGILTFLTNAYWIGPNLYYSFHNSDYVQQSRENQLFGPESVWSVREASTLPNLLAGTHYLLNWKDYSFADDTFDFIFNEWQDHVANPLTKGLLYALGITTIFGAILTVIDKQKGNKRIAILLCYGVCLIFIWIDLFPTNVLLDWLYESGSFLEAFRNPFTKLSIIYSFVSVLLFVEVFDFLLKKARNKPTTYVSIGLTIVAIIFTAWPSFQGHFISEKLQVKYPSQYQELFNFLKTKDKDLRVLQLPQLSHAGWEYYDWQFLNQGNGYQGMGFYFFGIPQSQLNRDSDRWVETSDFFYHQLKYALDIESSELLLATLQKYNVDLVIIDETKIDPTTNRDVELDRRLILDAGLEEVWHKDFLTIYQRPTQQAEQEIILPKQISFVAAQTDRVRIDPAYKENPYALINQTEANSIWPFADLMATKPSGISLNKNVLEITRTIPTENFTLTLPGLKNQTYLTPASISYQEQTVTIRFPQHKITVGETETLLPKITDFQFRTEETYSELIVFLGNTAILINQGDTITPILAFEKDQPVLVDYAPKPTETSLASDNIDTTDLDLTSVTTLSPSWKLFEDDTKLQTNSQKQLKITSEFPIQEVNLNQNPSINCSQPKRGTISTQEQDDKTIYTASNFAVNCNGYDFEYTSPAYSYLIHVIGESIQGRGTKLFVNYNDPEVLFEDFLLQDSSFNTYISLPKTSDDNRAQFGINWETRSFGKESINHLERVAFIPFPLEQFAQLVLEKDDAQIANPITINSYHSFYDSVHILQYQCQQDYCYVGLDQSYDDLWLAIQIDPFRVSPHFRLNNWANLWQVSQNGTVVIFYLPELVAFASLVGLTVSILVLIGYNYKRKEQHD